MVVPILQIVGNKLVGLNILPLVNSAMVLKGKLKSSGLGFPSCVCSGEDRNVATLLSFAGEHTDADHAKELNDDKSQGGQHNVAQNRFQVFLQFGLAASSVEQLGLTWIARAVGKFNLTAAEG